MQPHITHRANLPRTQPVLGGRMPRPLHAQRAPSERLQPALYLELIQWLETATKQQGPLMATFRAAAAAGGDLADPTVRRLQREAYEASPAGLSPHAARPGYLSHLFVRDLIACRYGYPTTGNALMQPLPILRHMVALRFMQITMDEAETALVGRTNEDALTVLRALHAHEAMLKNATFAYAYELVVVPLMAMFAAGGLAYAAYLAPALEHFSKDLPISPWLAAMAQWLTTHTPDGARLAYSRREVNKEDEHDGGRFGFLPPTRYPSPLTAPRPRLHARIIPVNPLEQLTARAAPTPFLPTLTPPMSEAPSDDDASQDGYDLRWITNLLQSAFKQAAR